MIKEVNVVGGGLAGVEATYQLVKEGIPVHLYEMRPVKKTDVHKTSDFAELVCSNSLRADGLDLVLERRSSIIRKIIKWNLPGIRNM